MLENLFERNHQTPQFSVTVTTDEKKDITQLVTDRIISITIDDNRGFVADMLNIELSDHDGKLDIPPRNAVLEVAIGWKGEQLINKGKFTVDEVEFSGAPDKLAIRARAADMKGSLMTPKERSFHNIKIGALIAQIAKEHGLDDYCGIRFEKQSIPHLDQANESDINLLSRLAEQYDAIATVKNGVLLFLPTGTAKTASGKDIEQMAITKKTGDSYSFAVVENNNYKAVRAYWYNTDNGKKGEVTIDENSKVTLVNRTTKKGKVSKQKKHAVEQTAPITSDSDQIKTLRHTYKYEASAIQGAKSAFDKLKRGVATFKITMAYGDPMLMPETPVQLKGFKREIDNTNWLITQVSHTITKGGYTCDVECELKVDEDK
ncbi:phage late control D family protein [Aggregatibacter actinomycetemcomitans]|uniref:phage late control D family protein n=1 Tax=Aggregatibacter actinomycetemcomitans TaxID=714 RepID=UPI00197BC058|nr:phage late control D family protein [Aggregatibacter actinomycetemcomitans]MBN6079909.1 phage late control D family protein [Aggregatibacter actinomycetemcomitans]